jgi:predicted O-linked N-acetylglucosamine transferase (SPINDLY family)
MANPDEKRALAAANSLYQQREFGRAAVLYRGVLERSPGNVRALHFLGLSELQRGNVAEGRSLVEYSIGLQPLNLALVENYARLLLQFGDCDAAGRACAQGLAVDPVNPALLEMLATSLMMVGRPMEALDCLDRLVRLQRRNVQGWIKRSLVLAGLNRHDEAIVAIDTAIKLNPKLSEAHLNRGTIQAMAARHREALHSYDRALALKSDLLEAWFGRATMLAKLRQFDAALAAFDRVHALRPDLAEAWQARGSLLWAFHRRGDALAAYRRALALKPVLAESWSGSGFCLMALKSYDEAIAAFDQALTFSPGLTEAWYGRGSCLTALKRYEEAAIAFDRAIAIAPDLAQAWHSRSQFCSATGRHGDAAANLERAYTLDPALPGLAGDLLRARMQICRWDGFDTASADVLAAINAGHPAIQPLTLLALPSSLEDQRRCARLWVADQWPQRPDPVWRGERYDHSRIRVAYLSADFRDHATAHLAAGLFEHHDTSRFEIIAVSLGPNDNSSMRARLERAFERFVDASTWDDERICSLVREMEIDILVDLNGLTTDSRTGILIQRCAPTQVQFLGYPGTMGTKHVDYIVADRTVIPDDERHHYDEKVVHLPDSYQVNDARRAIAARAFTREELGLPADGMVFCCFNSTQKITPGVFGSWMRILGACPASVLWLLGDDAAAENLRSEAEASGVDARRLVFAERIPGPEHLARHRCADLFLDTLPYNAHTTASDALWAGLPVLTCRGDTFAGRVAASLLTAVGLSELITKTAGDYEALAIELANNPARLAQLKQQLAGNSATAPLFDTARFAGQLEAVYEEMMARSRAGLAPDHIAIGPGLANSGGRSSEPISP